VFSTGRVIDIVILLKAGGGLMIKKKKNLNYSDVIWPHLRKGL